MSPRDNAFVHGLVSCKANSSWKLQLALWKTESRSGESCQLPLFGTRPSLRQPCPAHLWELPWPRAGFMAAVCWEAHTGLPQPCWLYCCATFLPRCPCWESNPKGPWGQESTPTLLCVWGGLSDGHLALAFKTFPCFLVEGTRLFRKRMLCKYLWVAEKHCSIKHLKKGSKSAIYGRVFATLPVGPLTDLLSAKINVRTLIALAAAA